MIRRRPEVQGGPVSPTSATIPVVGTMAVLAFCAMGALEFSGAFGVLAAYTSVSPYTVCLVAATVVGVLVYCWRGGERGDWLLALPVLAVGGYLVAETISYLASGLDPVVTSGEVEVTAKLVPYAAVISLLAIGLRRWSWVATAIVLPMALICALGLANEYLLHNTASFGGFATVTSYLGVGVETARHAGPLLDPNFWGRFLVVGIPLGLALTGRAWANGHRSAGLGAAACTALLFGGVYLSGSRGTFVACAVAVAAYLICSGVRLRTLAMVAVSAAALLVVPGVGSRLFSFGLESEFTQRAAEDGSALSRLATQRVALEMVRDRPIVGVGPGGYFDAFGQYAARGQVTIDGVIAPHNLYLGLLAETGVIGLVAFSTLLAVGIGLAAHALWLTRGMADHDRAMLQPYAAAVLAGILAWATASIFLHLSYARIVIFVACLAAALDVYARRLPQVRPRTFPPVIRRRITLGVVGALLVGSVGVALAQVLPSQTEVTRTGYLEPVASGDAYLIDLRTRTALVPTYALVIGVSSPTPVDAQGDPATGLITVTATGASRSVASAALERSIAAGRATQHRAGMNSLYTIHWFGPPTVTSAPPAARLVVGAGSTGAVAGAALGLFVAKRRTRASNRPDGL